MNTSRALNIGRGRPLQTDRVWQVCTVCASLMCAMARYEARSISRGLFWLPYSDPQSKPITNLLTKAVAGTWEPVRVSLPQCAWEV